MSKWRKYRKIEVVDVLLFERPASPADPPYPIELWPCNCADLAQDGRRCERHSTPPHYSYIYRAIDRWVHIRPGEYLVRFSNGQAITASPEEFGHRYEPVENS